MFIVGINSFFYKFGACFELGIRPPNFQSERERHMNTLWAMCYAFKFSIYNLRSSNSTPAQLFIVVFTYSNCQSIQSSKSIWNPIIVTILSIKPTAWREKQVEPRNGTSCAERSSPNLNLTLIHINPRESAVARTELISRFLWWLIPRSLPNTALFSYLIPGGPQKMELARGIHTVSVKLYLHPHYTRKSIGLLQNAFRLLLETPSSFG